MRQLAILSVRSIEEIRDIPDRYRRSSEVILFPGGKRYLWDPGSTADDDGDAVLVPLVRDCACCSESGRWIKEPISADGGGDTVITNELIIEGARITSSVEQTINASGVVVEFDTEESNDNGVADLGSNDTILTAQTDGPFAIEGRVRWKPGSNGTYHTLDIQNVDTSEVLDRDIRNDIISNAVGRTSHSGAVVFLLAGQRIRLKAYTDADDDGAIIEEASLSMYFLGGGGTASTAVGNPTGPAGGDLDGTYPYPQIRSGAIIASDVNATYIDGADGVPSLRTLGFGAGQAVPGDTELLTVADDTHNGLVPQSTPSAEEELIGTSPVSWGRRFLFNKGHTQYDVQTVAFSPFQGGSALAPTGTYALFSDSDGSLWRKATTGSTIGNKAGVASTGAAGFVTLTRQYVYHQKVKTDATLTSLRHFQGVVGTGDPTLPQNDANLLDCIGFFYGSDTSGGGGFWQIRLRVDAAHDKIVVTSVPYAASTVYTLRIDARNYLTTGDVKFYINDALMHTENVSSGYLSTSGMDAQLMIRTLAAAARSFKQGVIHVEID